MTIQIGENESSKYWLSVLNELKNRGVKDILILCADGLTGIKEAINVSSEVRKVIYTTNAIESLNSTYRRLNTQRSAFPSPTALLKPCIWPPLERQRNGLQRFGTGVVFMTN